MICRQRYKRKLKAVCRILLLSFRLNMFCLFCSTFCKYYIQLYLLSFEIFQFGLLCVQFIWPYSHICLCFVWSISPHPHHTMCWDMLNSGELLVLCRPTIGWSHDSLKCSKMPQATNTNQNLQPKCQILPKLEN